MPDWLATIRKRYNPVGARFKHAVYARRECVYVVFTRLGVEVLSTSVLDSTYIRRLCVIFLGGRVKARNRVDRGRNLTRTLIVIIRAGQGTA